MKKLLFLCLFCSLTICFYGQNQYQQTIFLAKTYGNFMFRNQPTKEVLKELKGITDPDMAKTVDFITQTITTRFSQPLT